MPLLRNLFNSAPLALSVKEGLPAVHISKNLVKIASAMVLCQYPCRFVLLIVFISIISEIFLKKKRKKYHEI